jgi:hypothetical protein
LHGRSIVKHPARLNPPVQPIFTWFKTAARIADTLGPAAGALATAFIYARLEKTHRPTQARN